MANSNSIPGLVVNGAEQTSFGTQTVPGGASNHVNPAGANVGSVGNRPDMPSSFYDLTMELKSARGLSSEGESYLHKLTELVELKGLKFEILPRTNAYLISNGTCAYGLLFHEHVSVMPDMTPATRQTDNVYKETSERYPDLIVLGVLLVHPTDYDRSAKMARWIDLALKLNTSAENGLIDLNNMSKNMFRVTTNRNTVMQVIDEWSPHGVPGYVQFGYVLEMCIDRSVKKDYRYNNRNQDNADWIPILVVGAYNNFISNGSYNQADLKFIHQIHMSEVLTMFPTLKMMPVVLAVAVQTFICAETWKDYFNQYDSSHPNICSLWFDQATGAPEIAHNAHERDAFIATRCTAPLLTLDVSSGRASIPGLLLYGTDLGQESLISQFAEFLGSNSFQNIKQLTMHNSIEYTGLLNFEAEMKDTRSFDYFKMLNSCNGDRNLLDKFVQFNDNPYDRLEALSAAGMSVVPLYETYMSILDDESLAIISAAVGHQFPMLSSCAINGRSTNFSSLSNAGTRLMDRINQIGPMFVNPNATRGLSNPYTNNALTRAFRR